LPKPEVSRFWNSENWIYQVFADRCGYLI